MRTLAVPVWGQGPCEALQPCGYVLIQVIARQLSQIIVCVCVFSCVQLFVMPGTVLCQASLSMESSREEYWSRLPCPPPGDLPNPGMEPQSLMSPALTGWFFTPSATWEAPRYTTSQLSHLYT